MSNYGLQTIFERSVSAVTATNGIKLGTKRWQDGREYMYIYNRGLASAPVGRAMSRIGKTTAVTSGFSGIVSTVTGSNDLMGVVVNTAIPSHYYGWLCTKGACPHAAPASTPTAFALGADLRLGCAGKFRKATATTAARKYHRVAVAISTYTTALKSFTVYVNC